ncbi:MAG: hypothetical protein DDT27_01314 [Dehalococcoidia bacterium]|nr:hypothetical protein [Chloroflexota bacterium]
MVLFISPLYAPQYLYGILHGGLLHQDRLKAALQSGVSFHIFAVVICGGCSDALNLPPRQRGL